MALGQNGVSDMNVLPVQQRHEVYHVEHSPSEADATLPYLFSNKFFESVPWSVLLTDPVGNEMKVSVYKQSNRVLLSHGWNKVGDLYGLQQGGWLQLKYTSLGNFYIEEVTNTFEDKVIFPLRPVKVEANDYANPICLDDDDDEDMLENVHHSSLIVDRSQFMTASKKWFSYQEITGNQLAFVNTWCQYALPKKDGHLLLVDEYGNSWDCEYKLKLADDQMSGIVRGWKKFCREKRLYQGQGAIFAVRRPNSRVLYFTPSS